MRRGVWTLGLLALGLLAAAFSAACKEEAASFSLVQSNASRTQEPAVSTEQLGTLVQGNTAFATELFTLLSRQGDGNLFFSPYSISIALAMTYAGATGTTATEMADVLHFDLPSDQLHAAFNRLDLEMEARADVDTADDDKREPFELTIANSIWAEKTYDFQPPFLQTLATHYGAGARLVDYRNDPEGAREAINGWVREETNERIPELIPQGAVDTMTRLVLTNAIFFKASWAEQFSKDSTRDGEFTLLSGSTVTAEMMHSGGSQTVPYAEGNGYQAIDLPYLGNEMSMLVILPDEGEFDSFESGLDAAALDTILASLESHAVDLVLPKFEFSSEVPLKQALTTLGMAEAFQAGIADFSGMDGTRDLYISDVLHQAFVSVDEEGTEAAAATAVVMRVTSAPLDPKLFQADRPFIFLIRDSVTGAVLFIGRVLDPTQ
jgi:serpin B